MHAITTCDAKTGRATTWIPPETSNKLTVSNVKKLLFETLGDLFRSATFDKERGLTMNFTVKERTDRRRIVAGLRKHKILAS